MKTEKTEKSWTEKICLKAIFVIAIVAMASGACVSATIPPGDDAASDKGTVAEVEEKTALKAEAKENEIKPAVVRTLVVTTSSLNEVVTATGTAAPKTDVTFSAEVPGRIEYLGAELGGRVKRGQVLARVDFRTLKAQKTQAEANYQLAKATQGRLANLGEKLVSRQKLDEVNSSLTGAEAQLAIASDSVNKSVLRSTINGIVSAKFVEKAEYVGPGAPMFRVVDYHTIILEAQLPETQVAMVTAGSKVAVSISALAEEFEGTVDTVLPEADPVSRTFTVRVKVKNPDLRILVGMSATVKIEARVHEGVVVLPQDVVIEGKGIRSVFVVKDGAAVRKNVRLGPIEGERVIILEGVEPGEEVIVLGHRDLIEGQPVEVVR